VVALAMLALPSLALADAKISRSGNNVTIVSDSDGDHITNAGTDLRRLITYTVRRGEVLRAGPGCVRLRGPRVTAIVVACGAPSQTQVNAVTLKVNLGGGGDFFQPAGLDDRQPRIVADGGAGNDTIYGTILSDDIKGGAGDDKLFGSNDVDNVDGGAGNDLILGGPGDDGLVGGAGRDDIYGDELRPTKEWGNDTITAALDFTPDRLNCGEGTDVAIVDADDAPISGCENLAGGQSTPPSDQVGTLPLAITIGPLAPTPGGLRQILLGQPIRLPVTFSAAAQIVALLRVSDAEANRLGLPGNQRTIADSLGTPLTLIPLTINTQIRLRWPVRKYLEDDNLVRATLTIVGESVDGARTTATKAITLRR